DPNGEARRVIRARAVDHPVLGRAALVAGGPFLQRALGVLGPAGMAVDRRTPDPMNDVAGLFEPAFEQARAEQGLHHVAEHVVAVGGAVVARLLAEADVRRRADGACNRGADLSADQGVEPLGQLALCRGRVVAVEPFGDRQAKHAVTEKLEPVVVARIAGAAVGQRLEPQGIVGDREADALEPVARLRCQVRLIRHAQIAWPIRLQRAAVNQVHGLSHSALPSVEKNMKLASPTRFSTGTMPTPRPGSARKRLSSELSRLSPIMNTWP